MSKILTFVISSKDNEKSIIKQLNTYLKNNDLISLTEVFIINDGSKEEYYSVLTLIKKFSNIYYIKNIESKGKVGSFLSIKFKIKTPYVCLLDDKDFFINYEEWIRSLKLMQEEKHDLYSFYMCNSNNQIIGKKMQNNETYKEFYYLRGYTGDHFFIFSKKLYYEFAIPEMFLNKLIQYEIIYLKNIFNIKYHVLTNKPLFVRDYNLGKYTKNLINNKIKNWEVTEYTSNLILEQNPCLKIRIVKLFELFLIRKRTKIIKKLNNKNKYLYYLLYLSFSFILIKKLYQKQINKLYN